MNKTPPKARRPGLVVLAAAWLALVGAPTPSGAQSTMAAPSPAAHLQRIPFTRATVDSPDGRAFVIAWSAGPGAGAVEVYARTSPQPDGPEGAGRLVGRGPHSGGIRVADLPARDRWYFELRPAHGGALVTADPSLHLATAPNFRDVGGHRTRDGRWVRVGLVYRSDELDRLSDADLAKVARLAPSLIVDLRTQAERLKGPDRSPPTAEPLVADVLADASKDNPVFGGLASRQAATDLLLTVNRQFVALPSAKDAYSRLFARVATTPGAIVYHCTAGKDRTGWATAVLLTALGVPRQSVMADYLASNRYLAEKNRAMFSAMAPSTAAKLKPALAARAAYLDAAFDEVDRRYGTFDRYLHDGLGLDDQALARLRSRLLAGAPDR